MKAIEYVEHLNQKLLEMPVKFNRHCTKKEWLSAKITYETAVKVADFMEIPMEKRFQLFGNRAYKEDWEEKIEGLFREEKVLKVYEECVVKRSFESSQYPYISPFREKQ